MMVEYIKAIGSTIKCMDTDNLHGRMEKVTKVSILRIKNKVKVDLTMEMDHITKVTGTKADNMEEASLETKGVEYMKGGMSMEN